MVSILQERNVMIVLWVIVAVLILGVIAWRCIVANRKLRDLQIKRAEDARKEETLRQKLAEWDAEGVEHQARAMLLQDMLNRGQLPSYIDETDITDEDPEWLPYLMRPTSLR